MKGFSLSLIVLSMVFLLSFALPEDKGKDHEKTLIESEKSKENQKFLQRRKPPGKVPGPALTFEERRSRPLASTTFDKESKMKYLSDDDERKKGKKDLNFKKYNKNTKKNDLAPLKVYSKNKEGNLHKDNNSLRGGRYNSEWKEETQEKNNIH